MDESSVESRIERLEKLIEENTSLLKSLNEINSKKTDFNNESNKESEDNNTIISDINNDEISQNLKSALKLNFDKDFVKTFTHNKVIQEKKILKDISRDLIEREDILVKIKYIISEKDDIINKLSKRISDFEIKQKKSETEKKQLIELKNSVMHLRSQFESVKNELSKKTDETHDKDSIIREIKDKNNYLINEKKELKEEIKYKENKIIELSTRRTKDIDDKDRISKFESELKEKENLIKELKNNISAFSDGSLKTDKKISDLLSIIDKKDNEIKKFSQIIKLKELNNNILNSQLIELKQSLAHKKDQLETIKNNKSNKSKEVLEKENNLKVLKKNLMMLKKKNEQLVSQLLTTESRLRKEKDLRIKSDPSENSKDKEKLKELSKNIENYKKREESLKALVKEKDFFILGRDQSIEKKDKEIRLLRTQDNVAKLRLKSSDDANKSLIIDKEKLTNELTNLTNEIKQLKDEKQKLDDHYKSLINLTERATKKKIRDVIQTESKKEVLQNMKINELKAIISKQKDIIETREAINKDIALSITKGISDVNLISSDVDYSILDDDNINKKIKQNIESENEN
jgi:hypothetical protein